MDFKTGGAQDMLYPIPLRLMAIMVIITSLQISLLNIKRFGIEERYCRNLYQSTLMLPNSF